MLLTAVMLPIVPGASVAGTEPSPFHEFQVTNTEEYEFEPHLGADAASGLITYASATREPSGWGQFDCYVQRISEDGVMDSPVRIADGDADTLRSDIYENLVVVTSYNDDSSREGTVRLYDVAAGTIEDISATTQITGAAVVHGDYAAWVEEQSYPTGRIGGHVVLKNVVHDGAEKIVGGLSYPADNVRIGSTFVVWDEARGDEYGVYAHDLRTGLTFPVATDPLLYERHASTSGTWIAYEESTHDFSSSRIVARDMLSGATREVAAGGALNYRPSVDGDIIAYESNLDGDFDIYVYHIPTGRTYQLTDDPADQRLNDVFGNQVAYVDGRNYNYDVFVTTFDLGPAAVDDSYATDEDPFLWYSVPAPGVLANDVLTYGAGTLTAISASEPPHGSVTLNLDGSFYYIPDADFHGTDTFTYRVFDGWFSSESATVTIEVRPVDDPPDAEAGGPYAGVEGTPVQLDGTGSFDRDGDALTYSWDFDGDVVEDSDEAAPTHTWSDDFAGAVTLTVSDGEYTTTDTAEVTIANVAPEAGFKVEIRRWVWGEEYTIYGAYTDPGGADTHTLEWDFGDGTIVMGELTGRHTYAVPGEYPVTFTVEDDDGGVDSLMRYATINERLTDVQLEQDSDTAGQYGRSAHLAARIADEKGLPVPSVEVRFTLGTQQVSAWTDADGMAAVILPLDQVPGVKDLTVSFAGDAFYASSSASATFEILPSGDADASPTVYDYGDIELGEMSSMLFSVSNVGAGELDITDVYLEAGSSPDFVIFEAPALPHTLPSSDPPTYADVGVMFWPSTLGAQTATLVIKTDDPDAPLINVVLSGTGVYIEPPPDEQVADVLTFIEDAVADGTLEGEGNGNSADNRLNALTNMVEVASDLIADGDYAAAYAQLDTVYRKCDGVQPPPDFVTGPAAAELAERILALMETLTGP